jgi:signal recognition particle receptor subunit beta
MAELNHKDRTIGTRIVYYGPGMSGKTTNVQVLHEHAQTARRGELVSVNTALDRTIMFDLLPLKVAAFRGLDLKVQLVAVPGQEMYAAVRKLALRDVDALVFVASSAADRQDENVASLKEMFANLTARAVDVASLPLVIQYNKRDLPDAVPIEAMDRVLNARQAIAVPSIAIRGEGVLETFAAVLTLTVADLTRRYRLSDSGRGQSVEEWSAAAVQEIFGAQALASPRATGSGAGRQTVRIALPPDVASADRIDARTNEALVESYAQAAVALTADAEQVREERDLAQKRLGDVLQLLDAARTLAPGAPRDPLLGLLLASLAQEVDTEHASLLVPAPNRSVRAAALLGLEEDPLLRQPEVLPRLHGLLLTSAPRWHETDHDPALRDVLAAAQPPHGSVISVPVGTGTEPLGVALLYRGRSAPPPRRETLKHLATLARLLAQFLEAPESQGRGGDASARELVGTAFRLAGPRLLQSLRDLRQRLADLRRRPDAPVWLPAALAEIAPTLGEATSLGRALTALDSGALEDAPVEVQALLAPLQRDDVHVELQPGVTTARVDRTLFGFALEALVERARRLAGAGRPIEIRAAAPHGRLALRVGFNGPAAGAPARGADPGLALVTKVLELHGGRTSVESDAALGSWVVLDVAVG